MTAQHEAHAIGARRSRCRRSTPWSDRRPTPCRPDRSRAARAAAAKRSRSPLQPCRQASPGLPSLRDCPDISRRSPARSGRQARRISIAGAGDTSRGSSQPARSQPAARARPPQARAARRLVGACRAEHDSEHCDSLKEPAGEHRNVSLPRDDLYRTSAHVRRAWSDSVAPRLSLSADSCWREASEIPARIAPEVAIVRRYALVVFVTRCGRSSRRWRACGRPPRAAALRP